MGQLDELVAVATEAGLDGDDVRQALVEGEHRSGVDLDIRLARHYGIRGVPFFVIDGRLGLSGAQPPDAFTRALRQAVAERDDAVAS